MLFWYINIRRKTACTLIQHKLANSLLPDLKYNGLQSSTPTQSKYYKKNPMQ